jgi:hypothetical protein
VDANLKFVTVDVGAYGKQSDGGVFQYLALYQSLETRSLQLPEDTVLPKSEITLPHIFVGDEVCPLTTYLMKPYSRRTLNRSKAIFNYRLSHARCVVESAFEICASKWRILDKATGKKVDTDVEIVKCIALLHSIIIDVKILHGFSSNDYGSLDANGGTQFKNSRMLPLLPNKRETYFVIFFTLQLVLYRSKWKLLETCNNSKSSLHYVFT